jgi:poly(3-hydroxybutyrate) depolymerase
MLRRLLRTWLLCGLCVPAFGCSDSNDPATPATSNTQSPPVAAAGSGALPGGSQPAEIVDVFSPTDHTVHPSAGCGSATGMPGSQTLTTSGQEGTYFVSLPPSYDGTTPASVAFVFHGANNTEINCFSGSNCPGVQMTLADKTVLIYPRSFGTSWTNETREQNVTWFDDLLTSVKANYCVDEHGIVAMGTSSGAHFSNILGCRRGDVLRAIAPGAGERLEKTGCKGEFAALVIHGIDDSASVPFRFGEEARDYYAMANGCSTETVPPIAEIHADVRVRRDAALAVTPRGSTAGIFRCADYQGCREGLPVRWCEHGEDGYDMSTHGYPLEGGPTTWDFVSHL